MKRIRVIDVMFGTEGNTNLAETKQEHLKLFSGIKGANLECWDYSCEDAGFIGTILNDTKDGCIQVYKWDEWEEVTVSTVELSSAKEQVKFVSFLETYGMVDIFTETMIKAFVVCNDTKIRNLTHYLSRVEAEDFIRSAFTWYGTEEGHDYWEAIDREWRKL